MTRTYTKKQKVIMDYMMIVVGTAVMSVGISCLFDPVGLVTGGFTGLSIVIKSVSEGWVAGGSPLWLTNIALNIPVFILAYFIKGKNFIGRTLFGTIMLSAWLYVVPVVDLAQGDYLISSIFGGVFSGIGIGMVIRSRATTGGTDMVAALIQKKFRHYSIVQIMQVIDGVVVLLGLFVFGVRSTLYAIIGVVVATKVSDVIIAGWNYSKAVYIITSEHETVAQRILKELDRGVTGLHAKGMYTGNEKCVLYCVMSQKEVVALKALVAEEDPYAFVIVSDVREVLGEGFMEYSKEF